MPLLETDSDQPVSSAPDDDAALEISKRFAQLLRDKVIRRSKQSGRVMVRAIGYRVIVFQLLLDPPQTRWSLQGYARELNCSCAWLSRIGLEFADEIGMAAHWQRLLARDVYAKRQTKGQRPDPAPTLPTSAPAASNREAIGAAGPAGAPTP